MKWNSRLVLLISLLIIHVKTESINTDFDITPLAACPTVNNQASYNYTNLFDKNIKTYWGANKCTFEGQDNVWYVSFTTSRLVEVAGYTITLATDGTVYQMKSCSPMSWILKAKEKEEQSWQNIDERNYTMTGEVNYENYTFNVNKPGKYQYFAFVITSLQ